MDRARRAREVVGVDRQRKLVRVLRGARRRREAARRPRRARSSSGALANRLGFALIVVGLLVSSARMARVDHTVSLVGFLLAAALGLYMDLADHPDPGRALMADYAKDVLVTTEWLAEHLSDGSVVVAEVDENPDVYDEGHLAGAVKLHWRDDLQDPVERDLVDRERFERLLGERGIANDSTVALYGDKNNWFAAVAYWYLKIYGHEDVRILDGGRQKWIDEGRELTTDVPSPQRARYRASHRDESLRAYRDAVKEGIGSRARRCSWMDVRSPQEFSGELVSPPGYEQEGAQRAGHIPTASRSLGRRQCATTAPSSRARSSRSCTSRRASPPPRRSRPTAASASAARTRGSSCASCSATSRSGTTTAPGLSGGTSSTSRSRKGRRRRLRSQPEDVRALSARLASTGRNRVDRHESGRSTAKLLLSPGRRRPLAVVVFFCGNTRRRFDVLGRERERPLQFPKSIQGEPPP
jgi:thiosulfate/3-mercaptopyruvate sulfurtransferase